MGLVFRRSGKALEIRKRLKASFVDSLTGVQGGESIVSGIEIAQFNSLLMVSL